MKVFILEDSFNRQTLFREAMEGKEIIIRDSVENAKSAYEAWKPFDLILLDHDLTDEHYENQQEEGGTGTEFARWLAHFNPECPIIIHSFNPDGAKRMESDLKRAGWRVRQAPFSLTLLKHLEQLQ